jgi:hypothetical protein
MSIATTKTTMFTAAVAAGVLAAAGTASPAGQVPIASAPAKTVSIPAGPSLASFATPNPLFAAVGGLPGPASGGSAVAGGPTAGNPVATALPGTGPTVTGQSGPDLFSPTIFAKSAAAPTGGGAAINAGGTTTFAAAGAVGGNSATTLAATAATQHRRPPATAVTVVTVARVASGSWRRRRHGRQRQHQRWQRRQRRVADRHRAPHPAGGGARFWPWCGPPARRLGRHPVRARSG